MFPAIPRLSCKIALRFVAANPSSFFDAARLKHFQMPLKIKRVALLILVHFESRSPNLRCYPVEMLLAIMNGNV